MNELKHIGTMDQSGRYKRGSGKDPYQRGGSFLAYYKRLQMEGMSESEIANAMGINTSKLRARRTLALEEQTQERRAHVERMVRQGMSNVAIARELGVSEGTVRNLRAPYDEAKQNRVVKVADALQRDLEAHRFLDVGLGVAESMGVSETRLKASIDLLQEQGYELHTIQLAQVTGSGQKTTYKILSKKGETVKDVYDNIDQISSPAYHEVGKDMVKVSKTVNFDSKRVAVRYAEDGGSERDGMIELRRGVDELSLGGASYAQVRIGIDGTHYAKGMAIYVDDLPPGVDMRVNSTKSKGTPLKGDKDYSVLKPIKDDPDMPFGAVTTPRFYVDKDGKRQQSAVNIIREEGDWNKWSRNLSAQMLGKQPVSLVKKQLQLAAEAKHADFDEIMSLSNPVVKKKLLESFADDCDASAVDLKAAALPRQRVQAIMPVPSMKTTEIYAPNFKNGEKVALIRYPHAGRFEIPELTVNNRHAGARKLLGQAQDAVGINHKVAQKMSGADFDGDFVVVIPNNKGQVKSSKSLSSLKNFDPQVDYRAYEGMPRVGKKTGFNKQMQMGLVSNLITDMHIRGATESEVARAVKHSMVVIDAEKHNLDWRRSERENGISGLRKKYQNSASGGASTLLSRSSSQQHVDQRQIWKISDPDSFDPVTGAKRYKKTGAVLRKKDPVTGEWRDTNQLKKTKSTKMAETRDARTLSSGTPVEEAYAGYANDMKRLGDRARLAWGSTKPTPYSPAAREKYKHEVAKLRSDLNLARSNAPLERQAQAIASLEVRLKKGANPDMTKDELKKVKGKALTKARARVGGGKALIKITDRQWEAIQAGAVSNSMLEAIVQNADLDVLRERATPRSRASISTAKLSRAKSMMAKGKYTRAEIADAIGVSVDQLNYAIGKDDR